MFAPPMTNPKSASPKSSAFEAQPRRQEGVGQQANDTCAAIFASISCRSERSALQSGEGAGPSSDFSKIPVFCTGAAEDSPAVSPLPNRISGFPIQAKLTVGAVNDPQEREADRVADQALHMPIAGHAIASVPVQISRKCAACEEETLQKKHAGRLTTVGEAPSSVHAVLRSAGRPLSEATRAYFEPRFGYDFSHVRVHTDSVAERSTRSLDANAYTVGHHIAFNAGFFRPENDRGRRLLAHELAHTIQQGASRSTAPMVQRDAATTSPSTQASQKTFDGAREISPENVQRLADAHRRWMQTREMSTEDRAVFAPVEIQTGHWTLVEERYDSLMSQFNQSPHAIQIDNLPDEAVEFYFVSWGELGPELEKRTRSAMARMKACDGDNACEDAVWADVAPAKFAKKQAGRNYMRRGLQAGKDVMEGGNPLAMGTMVFAHNVLRWTPERAAAAGGFVGGVTTLATGATYASATAAANRKVTSDKDWNSPRPGDQEQQNDVNPFEPRAPLDFAITKPKVETEVSPAATKVSLRVLSPFSDPLELAADAIRTNKIATQSTRQSPALATASIDPYGPFFTGVNEVPNREIHPLLVEQIKLIEELPRPGGKEGNFWKKGSEEHAEIQAASDAIYALEERLGRSVSLDEARSQIRLDIISRQKGTGMPPCARCALILQAFELTERTRRADLQQGRDVLSGNRSAEGSFSKR